MNSQKLIQLSPNSLNLYLECPCCFWLDKKEGIKRPPPYPYALNSAIDGLLKQEFDEIDTNPSDVQEIFREAVAVLKRVSPPSHSKDCAFGDWLKQAGDFNG